MTVAERFRFPFPSPLAEDLTALLAQHQIEFELEDGWCFVTCRADHCRDTVELLIDELGFETEVEDL